MLKRRCQRRFDKGKIRRIKLLTGLFITTLVAAGLYIAVDNALGPVIGEIAEIRTKEIVSESVNAAVVELLKEDGGENFLTFETDQNGYISMVNANTVYMNEFSSQITKMVHDGLKNLKTEKVKISVGAILGSNIMTQTGPSIGLKIRTVGNATVNFFTEFESGGINQTKYKVYMQVVGKAKPVIPFVSETYEVVTTVPVAETVIVGNVPQTYLSLPLK